MTILFYRKDETPYGVFSNFSPHPIELDDHLWPTVEHYYQAQKFVGMPAGERHMAEIRRAPTAYDARRLGIDPSRPLRPDWDEVRLGVMWRAIQSKFDSYGVLEELLLSTGDEEIAENSPYDSFWGLGPNGDGENRFGHMLMRLRQMYAEELAEDPAAVREWLAESQTHPEPSRPLEEILKELEGGE